MSRSRPTQDQRDRFDYWNRTYFTDKRLTIHQWFGIDAADIDQFIAGVDVDGAIPDRIVLPWHEVVRYVDGLTAHSSGAGPDFSQSILPFLKFAKRQLGEIDLARFAGERRLRQDFIEYLARRLQPPAYPSAGLAFHFAKANGAVGGVDDQDLLRDFLAKLQIGPERRLLLSRFPVGDRIQAEITVSVIAMFSEMVERLIDDAKPIADQFGIDIAMLSSIEFGVGDPHANGRCVSKLNFGKAELLYKPKSLETDILLAEIFSILNERLPEPLPHCSTLTRSAYGWVEPAMVHGCDTAAEVRGYFRRIGALLALHYVTGASDVHFENILASGGAPVVVDTETVVQLPAPRPPRTDPSYPLWHRIVARNQTVLGVGLLPNLMLTPEGTLLDLSGTGCIGDQATPFQQPHFENFNSGAPRIEYRPGVIEQKGNLPVFDDTQQSILEHEEEVVEGFRIAYEAFLDSNARLRAEDGALMQLARLPMRWVARPTTEYALALRGSYHPSCMRNGYERDLAFSVLLDEAASFPSLLPLIPYEVKELWRGDIPYFKTAGDDDKALSDSLGQTVDTAYFDISQPDYVRSRLNRLGKGDLDRQIAIIRGSIAARRTVGGPPQPAGAVDVSAVPLSLPEIAHVLEEIETDLTAAAIDADGLPTWTAPVQRGALNYSYDVIGLSLYDGLAGIGLFYAEYAKRFDASGRSRVMAENILNSLNVALNCSRPKDILSAFEGLAGVLYACIRMGRSLDVEAEGIAPALEALKAGIHHLGQADVIAGHAGVILALRGLLGTSHRDSALEVIDQSARWLKDHARLENGRASWPSGPNAVHLTGFAHGACGIAVALAEAARILDDSGYMNLAAQAIAFEQSTFDVAAANWRDRRTDIDHATAWCHGAPGIALARMALRGSLPEPALDGQTAAALAAMVAYGGEGSHSLCHGAIGNAVVFNRGGDHKAASALVSRAVSEYRAEGRWRCGLGGYMDSPALMLGKSGIGLGLMETLAGPDMPSVLLLEA